MSKTWFAEGTETLELQADCMSAASSSSVVYLRVRIGFFSTQEAANNLWEYLIPHIKQWAIEREMLQPDAVTTRLDEDGSNVETH